MRIVVVYREKDKKIKILITKKTVKILQILVFRLWKNFISFSIVFYVFYK